MQRHKLLENTLQSYNITFTRVDDDIMDVVDYTKAPESFIGFILNESLGDFPDDQDGYTDPISQEEFAQKYYNKYKNKVDTFTEEYKLGWFRRCQVSYTSLIRDIHFYYLVKDFNEENNVFDSVEYSVEMDVEHGVDMVIKHEGETYYINLYVDSDKSQAFLDEKKDHRHPDHTATEIHLPISASDPDKKVIQSANDMDIWLYSDTHLSEILAIVI